MDGRVDEAAARLDLAIDICQRIGDKLHLGGAYVNRQVVWMQRHDVSRAIADLRRAVAVTREIGQPQLERAASHNLAELLCGQGELDEAWTLAQRSRAIHERVYWEMPIPSDALLLARIACARGDTAEARAQMVWIETHCPQDTITPAISALIDMVKLWVAAAEYRPAPQGAWADEGSWRALVARAEKHCVESQRLEVLYMAAVSALGQGQTQAAAAWIEEAVALAPSSPWATRFRAL